MEHDISFWKLDKLIKSNEDRSAVERFITEKMLYLKDIYIELAAETAYPYVS